MGDAAGPVTALLQEWSLGDRGAFDQLVPLIYDELRGIAARHLRGERAGHSLRPTDLVSEAYVRLVGASQPPEWNGRAHFFAIAARTMRQILVDHARKRATDKRGGGQRAVTLDETIAAGDRPEELIAIDDALTALAAQDERKARVIELHYFGGMTQPEIATALEVHVNTVARDLRLAEAWIQRRLDEGA